MSKFGDCQVHFSTIHGAKEVIAFLLALPKPTRGYRNADAEKDPTFIKADDTLIYSNFPLTRARWVKLMQQALDHAGIGYTQESLKDGKYTSDVFLMGKVAFTIASLRRGGVGILAADLQHVQYLRENDKEARAKTDRRQKALASLTIEQRRALGI